MTIQEVIQKYNCIAELFQSVDYQYMNHCFVKSFARNSMIVLKGQIVEMCYIIVEGEAEIINQFENGKNFVYAKTGAGALVGEMELLGDKKEYTSTVRCATDCITIEFSKDILLYWFNHYLAYAIAAAKRVGAMICRTNNRSGETTVLSSEDVLASLFIQQYEEAGSSVCIADTRQQLADKIGSSSRTVDRVIRKLKSQNLIRLDNGKIYIDETHYRALSRLFMM